MSEPPAEITGGKYNTRDRLGHWVTPTSRQGRACPHQCCRGHHPHPRGLAAGVNERSLFTGPESRVRAYASPELFEFFESNPRPTRASYFGSAKTRRAHLAGRRIG